MGADAPARNVHLKAAPEFCRGAFGRAEDHAAGRAPDEKHSGDRRDQDRDRLSCYQGIADFLLLNSHRAADRQSGTLGVTHDWRISRRTYMV